MSHVDPAQVLSGLKDFQRRSSLWAFENLFLADPPSRRFLVADEVGLGKTHVAKGVVAQVIDHLQKTGDRRHDIVYICSNGSIARQNLRKLVPKGIEPLDDVERLTMLPLAQLREGDGEQSGVNLLAITPGTSLKFGRSSGKFPERCLAYAFLRELWGDQALEKARARWIFWHGIAPDGAERRLLTKAKHHRAAAQRSKEAFANHLAAADAARMARQEPTLREVFDRLVDGLAYKRHFPDELWEERRDLIGTARRVMAEVGIAALDPDLVILDEFQRFKDLLKPDPDNFAAMLAHRLFDHKEPESGRATRTLLLSATPYKMYTTGDDVEADHYEDFLATCEFLFAGDRERVEMLAHRFRDLRESITSADGLSRAHGTCEAIAGDLRRVMCRTERLAATPDRDGMLREIKAEVGVGASDVAAYLRIGDLAEAASHHEPVEYWKSAPYPINFMEGYKLKRAISSHVEAAGSAEALAEGPGLLDWQGVEKYEDVEAQNGRLRWLLGDLKRHRAFELLWIPPSLRYYDTGSVYDSDEARSFTKRLLFSGWTVVPKAVSAMVTYEAERVAYARRQGQTYSAAYAQRGGQRLTFRTAARDGADIRPGEAGGNRRAAAMTTFLLVWPSATLARLGDPRRAGGGTRPSKEAVLEETQRRLDAALKPLTDGAPARGNVDARWYWAAPLFLDRELHTQLLDSNDESIWNSDKSFPEGSGFGAHMDEARAMVDAGTDALGKPPDDLARVLADVAVGGPGPCALRALSSVTGLAQESATCLNDAIASAFAFVRFFNAPEVTGLVSSDAADGDGAGYWQDVVSHCVDGNLQALLDEHLHVLREWLGFVELDDDERRGEAAGAIVNHVVEALDLRSSVFRVDVPSPPGEHQDGPFAQKRMRSRLAAALGHQVFDETGEARVESLSTAFNSPFWPFVLTSTSVGQEGLDFHLWSHSVVHWNLPSNPVDLEQREGRVHRYKGHVVRRNVAAAVGSQVLANANDGDLWDALFAEARDRRRAGDGEIVPYWVFSDGPARIERYVPSLPFSREQAALPQLRKSLAAYRLAFGQPRQEELIDFLGDERSGAQLLALTSRLRIDLSPPSR